ncbi:MAG: hypothetical protein HY459_03765, partial [Parcubacteria group bacterium]|nr:hypothetical protein [Parcubacteria group bacterium]
MTRPIAFIILIFVATLAAIPSNFYLSVGISDNSPLQPPSVADPAGAPGAFNLTYAISDHHTNATATTQPLNGNITWFAALRRTSNNSLIPNTAFAFNITTTANVTGIQSIKWNVTIPSPKSSCPNCNSTVVRFTVLQSALIPGANATFAFLKSMTTIFGPSSLANRTTNIPSSRLGTVCPEAAQICFDASGHVNSTLTLLFVFGWNLTGAGQKVMKVDIGKLLVFSTNLSFAKSSSHTMTLVGSMVTHSANVTVSYNRTMAAGASHNWNSSIVTLYYPTKYQIDKVINSTATFYPTASATVPDPYPFETGSCQTIDCSAIFPTSFVSLNMTDDRALAKVLTILAASVNAVTSIETILNGASTDFWMPGDTIGVRVRIEPSVNVSGTRAVALTDPDKATILNQNVTSKGGLYVHDVTIPSTTTLGPWNVTGEFVNGYDHGRLVHPIRVEQIKINALSMSGTVGQGATLSVQGNLAYKSSSSTAQAVNATVFAVDAGSPPGPLSSTGSASSGLYISNVTLTNGVFTQNQPLIIFFTVVNPTLSTAFSANVTVDHEWYDGFGGDH